MILNLGCSLEGIWTARPFCGCKLNYVHLLVLSYFFYRNWQDRRIACTDDVIAFARVNESMLLDAIPLSEVTAIEFMKKVEGSDEKKDLPRKGFESVTDFTNAFQIRTMKHGQNAGRKYVLRATSDDEVATIINQLNLLAKKAVKKAAARTLWEKLQQRVRSVYTASWFQGISAFLIVAVCRAQCCYELLGA